MIFLCKVSSSDQEIGTYRIISWKNSTYHLNLGRLHNVIDKAELYFLWILFGIWLPSFRVLHFQTPDDAYAALRGNYSKVGKICDIGLAGQFSLAPQIL